MHNQGWETVEEWKGTGSSVRVEMVGEWEGGKGDVRVETVGGWVEEAHRGHSSSR